MWLLGRGGQAALTLQSEWVRWRGELMSLGVDERSPSATEASEMTEGWREWQGLILTTAGCITRTMCTRTEIHRLEKFPQLVGETTRKPSISALSNQHQAPRKPRSRADKRAYPVCPWCARGRGSVGSDEWPQWAAGRPASPTPGCRSPQALWAWPMSAASVRPWSGWRGTASPGKHKKLQLWDGSKISTLLIQICTKIPNVDHSTTKIFPNNAQFSSQLIWAKATNAKRLLFALLTKLYS